MSLLSVFFFLFFNIAQSTKCEGWLYQGKRELPVATQYHIHLPLHCLNVSDFSACATEQLASEKQRHKQMLRDLEATKNKEVMGLL